MDKLIGPATSNIIDSLTFEISKKKNRKKIIKRVITPILEDINKNIILILWRCYHY